ncbi:MAG: hypothetical protein ACRD2C_09410 [Acidimicrobiales bacterium]
MNGILVQVLVWQALLIGWWAVGRRLRRLERAIRPPCYAQVGALREQVVGLRTEQALDTEELARVSRKAEKTLALMSDEARVHFARQERTSAAVLEWIRRVDDRLARLGPEDHR